MSTYVDEDGFVRVNAPDLAENIFSCSPIVQFYQPNYRFEMQSQTEFSTRLEGRGLPRLILEAACDFGRLQVNGDVNKLMSRIFYLIKDLLRICHNWLNDLKSHPLHPR
jgi:hypothetical protein